MVQTLRRCVRRQDLPPTDPEYELVSRLIAAYSLAQRYASDGRPPLDVRATRALTAACSALPWCLLGRRSRFTCVRVLKALLPDRRPDLHAVLTEMLRAAAPGATSHEGTARIVLHTAHPKAGGRDQCRA